MINIRTKIRIKVKDTKQKESHKSTEIREDDVIKLCSFTLPFEPVKKKDSNSPLYHILYKVIEKEKNINVIILYKKNFDIFSWLLFLLIPKYIFIGRFFQDLLLN